MAIQAIGGPSAANIEEPAKAGKANGTGADKAASGNNVTSTATTTNPDGSITTTTTYADGRTTTTTTAAAGSNNLLDGKNSGQLATLLSAQEDAQEKGGSS